MRIEFEQKPEGSGSNYPAVGRVITNDFGTQLFERDGYPQKDGALKCQREYNGTGASQRISWIIDVPDGYNKTIALVWGKRDFKILYEPQSETQKEKTKIEIPQTTNGTGQHTIDPAVREIDPHTVKQSQSRAQADFVLIEEYADRIIDGLIFDPCDGIETAEGEIWVWDGYHRTEAAKRANKMISVRIATGTKEDADWLAFGANTKHGLRRTNEDVQRVVKNALKHPKGVNLSNRELARHCGCDEKTIRKYRAELETSAEIPQTPERTVKRNGKSYQMEIPSKDAVEDIEKATFISRAMKHEPAEGKKYPCAGCFAMRDADMLSTQGYCPACVEIIIAKLVAGQPLLQAVWRVLEKRLTNGLEKEIKIAIFEELSGKNKVDN